MACTMTGTGTLTAVPVCIYSLVADVMTGAGTQTAVPVVLYSMASTMTGRGTLTGTMSILGDIYEPPYILEVHDSTGDLICVLENASVIDYERKLNTPHTLTFTMPADDSKVSNIILANEIWLRNYRTGIVIRKFMLQNTLDSRK